MSSAYDEKLRIATLRTDKIKLDADEYYKLSPKPLSECFASNIHNIEKNNSHLRSLQTFRTSSILIKICIMHNLYFFLQIKSFWFHFRSFGIGICCLRRHDKTCETYARSQRFAYGL